MTPAKEACNQRKCKKIVSLQYFEFKSRNFIKLLF